MGFNSYFWNLILLGSGRSRFTIGLPNTFCVLFFFSSIDQFLKVNLSLEVRLRFKGECKLLMSNYSAHFGEDVSMEMASLADLSFGSEKNYFPGECRQDGLRLSLFRFLIVDILFLMSHEFDILYKLNYFSKFFIIVSVTSIVRALARTYSITSTDGLLVNSFIASTSPPRSCAKKQSDWYYQIAIASL